MKVLPLHGESCKRGTIAAADKDRFSTTTKRSPRKEATKNPDSNLRRGRCEGEGRPVNWYDPWDPPPTRPVSGDTGEEKKRERGKVGRIET